MKEAAEMNLDTVVVATQDQVCCQLSGETVILHLEDGVYYGLNPVGAHVWNLIQKPRTLKSVIDSITEEFDVDLARAEQDLFSLLREMASRRLVDIRNDAQAS